MYQNSHMQFHSTEQHVKKTQAAGCYMHCWSYQRTRLGLGDNDYYNTKHIIN